MVSGETPLTTEEFMRREKMLEGTHLPPRKEDTIFENKGLIDSQTKETSILEKQTEEIVPGKEEPVVSGETPLTTEEFMRREKMLEGTHLPPRKKTQSLKIKDLLI